MPGQLFLSTQIPVSLWFLARNKENGFGQQGNRLRDRRGEILFIDARNLGEMEDRTHRILPDADIAKITDTYHAWRGDSDTIYEDIPGFCNSTQQAEVKHQGCVLTPGRYVGVEASVFDSEAFGDQMERLIANLRTQQADSVELFNVIQRNLKVLGYEE